jgi:hypothetical protein
MMEKVWAGVRGDKGSLAYLEIRRLVISNPIPDLHRAVLRVYDFMKTSGIGFP